MFRMDMHAGPETALLIHPATKKSSANSCCFNICSRRTQSGGRQYTQYGTRLYASCVTLVMRGRTFRLRRNSAGPQAAPQACRRHAVRPAPPYTAQPTDAAGSEALSAFVSAGPGTAHAAGGASKAELSRCPPGQGCAILFLTVFSGKRGKYVSLSPERKRFS